jgi:hypothetical protein
MDWWGRLWGARKWSLAGLAPFLSGDRMWIAAGAVVVPGVALIIAVCWLAHRTKDEKDVEIESPILSLRRGKPKRKASKKSEEQKEKDSAST